MKILLATGIYPPEIGGPATYVQALATEFLSRGHEVVVVAYGVEVESDIESSFPVIRVSREGGPFTRWHRYARVLRERAEGADVVYAFSSVSVGMPLRFAKLKGPKTILRLGGDFLWERYTDRGGRSGLRAFYQFYRGMRFLMAKLLKRFDAVVFSTTFQARLMEYLCRDLPPHAVIENALPPYSEPVLHTRHEPLRLLYLGRFVRFKNLPALLRAVARLPYVSLTLVGDGPMKSSLEELMKKLSLGGRVRIELPAHGVEKQKVLLEHDLLIMPSLTEISPHSAIEARSMGLPVLLTEDTGLSPALSEQMVLRPLKTAQEITRAILEIERSYEELAAKCAQPLSVSRTFADIADETLALIDELRSRSDGASV